MNTYLLDKEFLKQIDLQNNRTEYIKLTILSMAETPIAAIEGLATGGNISVNGSSAVRRTGSVSLLADDKIYNITDVDNLISMNKKVRVEKGISNHTIFYPLEPIVWFPLGEFCIDSASISNSSSGLTISINLKDKMALLNGDIGGVLPIGIIHSPIDQENADGSVTREVVEFKAIIRTLVNEYGGVPNHKIIIQDIPDYTNNIVRWVGENPVYLYNLTGMPGISITNPNSVDSEIFSFGDNIGYTNTAFVYPQQEELSSGAGDSITSVLDKVKGALGNFEYFFDLDGNFRFQQIKDYINEGSPEDNLEAAIAGSGRDYLVKNNEKSVYDFSDATLVTAFQNSPKYNAVKNDIAVWGIRGDKTSAVFYHIVIDDKPTYDYGRIYQGYIYDDGVGNMRAVSLAKGEEMRQRDPNAARGPVNFVVKDWRSQIYFEASIMENLSSPYAKELREWWPRVYNIEFARWRIDTSNSDDVKKNLNNMVYFFDIINPIDDDGVEVLGDFKVSKIGRRQKVINDEQVNCLFMPTCPEYYYIEAGLGEETKRQRVKCLKEGKQYIQVPESIADNLALGSAQNAAYDTMRSCLHELTSYNESINVTCIPIYHLEPNTRITVNDDATCIHGDYMLKSFSVPLTANGTMTLQCTKAVERI